VPDPLGPNPPLIDAVRAHDVAAVRRLLRAGAEVDLRDGQGRTPLHHAVAAGNAEIAACLLVYGAEYALCDHQGRRALDPAAVGMETMHAIRQRYHRFREDDAERPAEWRCAERWAAELDRRGIVKVTGLIEPDAMHRMRREFETFVRNLGREVARGSVVKTSYFEEEHWWPEQRAFVSNNAFKHSSELVRFSCRPELLEAAHLYLGRPASIQRAVAMRYLAGVTPERDMFRWHHDLEDKRLKVMILLTDVGPDDQHMSYACGSHTLFHPYRMFLENACDLEYCRRHLDRLEIYDATGKAGDFFLFDTNGAHRGIRRHAGRVRDVYLIELSASTSNIWGGDVDARIVAEARPRHDPFEGFMAAEKKWEVAARQQSPSWVETLAHIDAWL
jgi:hypothetical protein